MDRARLISAIAYAGDKNAVRTPIKPAPPRASKTQQLQAELKTLRLDPAYFDKSRQPQGGFPKVAKRV